MWQTLKLWLAAAALGVTGMLLLLFVVSTLTTSPEPPAEIETEAPPENPDGADGSCSFRVFGSVTDESGNPVEAVTISLRGIGPFASTSRTAQTNSSGRFVYLESGFSTCVLEDLYPSVTDPADRYREWSRPEPVENDEQLRIVLERATANASDIQSVPYARTAPLRDLLLARSLP